MKSQLERSAFVTLFVCLGGALLFWSVRTLMEAGTANLHLALLAGLEAMGAALFLFPRTQRAGGVLLLLSFLFAFLTHALHGSYHLDLVVYAAATWYVMVRGRRNAT